MDEGESEKWVHVLVFEDADAQEGEQRGLLAFEADTGFERAAGALLLISITNASMSSGSPSACTKTPAVALSTQPQMLWRSAALKTNGRKPTP